MSGRPGLRGGLQIGLVCPYSFASYGGVQNHVLGLARYLRDQGHHPHILAPGLPEPEAVAGLSFTSAGGSVPVPYNGSIARVNFGPRPAARVRRWMRGHSLDLVHIHEPITPSVGLLALWLADVPVVATFHTATPRSRTMAWAGEALGGLIAKIGAGMAVSEPDLEEVRRYLGRDVDIVPNGVTHTDFSAPGLMTPPTRFRGGDRPRITFLGRLDERRKGLEVLIAALPRIRAGLPDADVVVAGSGSRVLPPGVRTIGAVSDTDKALLLAGTDVFVAPHLERESFGVVLVEALAGGADVVASDLPAFVDLLRLDGADLGRLVPVGDPEALAAAVIERIKGLTPSAQPAAAAAVRRFDWSVVGAQVGATYARLLDRTRSRRSAEFELIASAELR